MKSSNTNSSLSASNLFVLPSLLFLISLNQNEATKECAQRALNIFAENYFFLSTRVVLGVQHFHQNPFLLRSEFLFSSVNISQVEKLEFTTSNPRGWIVLSYAVNIVCWETHHHLNGLKAKGNWICNQQKETESEEPASSAKSLQLFALSTSSSILNCDRTPTRNSLKPSMRVHSYILLPFKFQSGTSERVLENFPISKSLLLEEEALWGLWINLYLKRERLYCHRWIVLLGPGRLKHQISEINNGRKFSTLFSHISLASRNELGMAQNLFVSNLFWPLLLARSVSLTKFHSKQFSINFLSTLGSPLSFHFFENELVLSAIGTRVSSLGNRVERSPRYPHKGCCTSTTTLREYHNSIDHSSSIWIRFSELSWKNWQFELFISHLTSLHPPFSLINDDTTSSCSTEMRTNLLILCVRLKRRNHLSLIPVDSLTSSLSFHFSLQIRRERGEFFRMSKINIVMYFQVSGEEPEWIS